MGDWWSSLTGLQQVYWGIAIPFTIIFLILLAISIFTGVDSDMPDGDVDADIDGDHGIGFQFITLKNIIGFFTIFAWSGLVCIDAGLGTVATVFVSSISGLIMMVIMATLFYFMSKLQGSGTLIVSRAKNGIGEVYLTIPGNRKGMGKVQIKIQGTLRELEAITDQEEDIPTGAMVTVKDVVNDEILLVTSNN